MKSELDLEFRELVDEIRLAPRTIREASFPMEVHFVYKHEETMEYKKHKWDVLVSLNPRITQVQVLMEIARCAQCGTLRIKSVRASRNPMRPIYTVKYLEVGEMQCTHKVPRCRGAQ